MDKAMMLRFAAAAAFVLAITFCVVGIVLLWRGASSEAGLASLLMTAGFTLIGNWLKGFTR